MSKSRPEISSSSLCASVAMISQGWIVPLEFLHAHEVYLRTLLLLLVPVQIEPQAVSVLFSLSRKELFVCCLFVPFRFQEVSMHTAINYRNRPNRWRSGVSARADEESVC